MNTPGVCVCVACSSYIYTACLLIMTCNTGGNTVSTAQLALSLLCTAARRISEGNMSMKVQRKRFQHI